MKTSPTGTMPTTPAEAAAAPACVRFPLGQIVATPAALALLDEHGIVLLDLLTRHSSGDWGDVCAEDAEANDAELIHGGRLLSSYTLASGNADSRIWLITEADRSVTTALLPSEY